MKTLITAFAALALLPIASAAEVKVSYSPDFAEELADNYGEREGVYLTEKIVKDLNKAFDRAGIDPARVEVTIMDAKPNRPTYEQLSARPGLDMLRSISIGGMELQATAYDADGNELGSKNYGWFEHDIQFVIGLSTWSDARRASGRFSRKFATQLAG